MTAAHPCPPRIRRDHVILLPCGTNAAYARHIRRREPVDEACQEAHRHYGRLRYSITFLAKSRLRGPRYQALEALFHRHRAEYAELYAAALREDVVSHPARLASGETP